MRVHRGWGGAGERDAGIVERRQADRASNSEILPAGDGRTDREQCGQRSTAGNDDIERRRRRDDREENSLGEL
jgi:hypothetical protein